MLKQHWGLVGGGLALSFVCAIGYGLYRLPSLLLADALEIQPTLIESSSPADLGTAAFLRESAMTDSSVYFYVRDSFRSSRPLLIGNGSTGYSTDGDVEMEQAVWSGDGSVIAVRAKDGETATQKNGVFFVDAYDFKKHCAVGTGLKVRRKSQAIKELLRNRGGEGQVAVRHPYGDEHTVALDEDQAEEFKRPFPQF